MSNPDLTANLEMLRKIEHDYAGDIHAKEEIVLFTQSELNEVRQKMMAENRRLHFAYPPLPPQTPDMLPLLNKHQKNKDLYYALAGLYRFLFLPELEDGYSTNDKSRDTWTQKVLDGHQAAGEKVLSESNLRVNELRKVIDNLSIVGMDLPETETLINEVPPEIWDGVTYKRLPLVQKRIIVQKLRLLASRALQIANRA